MKTKTLSLILFAALLVAACSPAPAAEEVMVEDSMEKSEEVMEKDAMDSDEVMEKDAMDADEAMEKEDGDHSEDAMMEAEVSFAMDIWPVIEMYALNAHGGTGGVFLESYEDIMEYVVPGSPEESMLYKALTGDGMPVMPPSGKLPDDVLQLFYDWIAQGAKDNQQTFL